ncbi:MAG: helix-turn-helix transcriptional regulator [Anaerolineae bacterium]|nr:helix-turn-helix transcriptional regulator [Anaerolineae bacterium]
MLEYAMPKLRKLTNDQDSDLVRLGTNLAAWRGLTGLSQEAVAQAVARTVPDFNRTKLNAIEHGQRWPLPDELRALTHVYHVAPEIAVEAVTRDPALLLQTLTSLTQSLPAEDQATLLHIAMILHASRAITR